MIQLIEQEMEPDHSETPIVEINTKNKHLAGSIGLYLSMLCVLFLLNFAIHQPAFIAATGLLYALLLLAAVRESRTESKICLYQNRLEVTTLGRKRVLPLDQIQSLYIPNVWGVDFSHSYRVRLNSGRTIGLRPMSGQVSLAESVMNQKRGIQSI